ncbi:MAG: type II secretion system minor pseudopilin GspJ [Tahibacter sp.]
MNKAHFRFVTSTAGFTLVEVLVAVAVFATMAALAWGGLNAVIRVRETLLVEQEDFTRIQRMVGVLERDLGSAVRRTVRGNYGEPLAAMIGGPDQVEFTHAGFASPLAEARSSLERVVYELDLKSLKRGRYAALDRAPGSAPQLSTLRDRIESFRLRYLDKDGHWFDRWPPRDPPQPDALPRAVEFRIDLGGAGEITRLIELAGAAAPIATAP